MSPDNNEPNAAWQGPSLHWAGPPPDEGMHPLSYEHEEADEINSNPPVVPQIEESGTAVQQGSSSPFESLKDFGLQISLIITPLLFGVITFLFLQMLMRSDQFYLHADRLWPIGLVIIAAMILQGMMLFYAGTNNSYWILAIVGGFFLFLLVGCFALFGPVPTLLLLIVLLIACTIAARFTTHPVTEGNVEIVYAFGAYSRTLTPGLNFMLPWEKVTARLHTKERIWTCPEQTAPISRAEDVHLKATISYQLMENDAHLAVLQVDNWEENLQELFKAALQSTVNHLTPEDILSWADGSSLRQSSASGLRLSNPENVEAKQWNHINLLLLDQLQNDVASWGVQMNWVRIRDISLTPRTAAQINTDPYITMAAASAASTTPAPPVQGHAQSSRSNAGKATAPPVVGNQAPPVIKPAAEPPPPTAPRAKPPNEEVLKNAYKQIQNGSITSPEVIRSIAAGFQAIADDPEASKNATFDATRAAQTLYERADLYEAQATAATAAPPVSARQASGNDPPTQSGWAYRTPSDDNMLAGG